MLELTEIKVLRKRYGITQKELAKAANVSQSLIAKIESGLIDAGYSKAKQIFEALEAFGNKTGLKARDLMTKGIITVDMDESLSQASQKMKKHGISQMPVVSGGRPVGTVNESLIIDAIMEGKPHSTAVKDIMDNPPPTLDIDASLNAVNGILKFYPLILITRKDKILGVITKADLMSRAFR